jgi:hypothetical protein
MYALRPIFVGLLAICAFSCSSPNTANQKTQLTNDLANNTQKPAELQNTAPRASKNMMYEEKLQELFTATQQAELKTVEKAFNAIKNAEDLAIFYRQTLPTVLELMDKKINQYDPENTNTDNTNTEKWKWFTDYMPYISVEMLCSECGIDSYIVLNPLRDKAEITPEKTDDIFFDALLTAYTNPQDKEKTFDKRPNNWIAIVNCDLCGASIFGNEKHLNTLKAIEKAQKQGALFAKELTELQKQAIPYQATNYYYEKNKVLAEIENILHLTNLTKKEKETFKNMRYLLTISKDIQFDCQKGNCQFLAM